MNRKTAFTVFVMGVLICSICAGILTHYLISPLIPNSNPTSYSSQPNSQAYDDILTDKIYTFYSGEYTINLTDLEFQKGMNYKIRMAAVSDGHVCHMDVDVSDPEGDLYEIYTTTAPGSNPLSFNDYRQIPFGAALSGYYNVCFRKLDGPTMNIHLQVLTDEPCINKITDPDAIIRTEIDKFSKQAGGNNDIVYHYLHEQRMYQVFIARISPVRGDHLTNISIGHSLRDDCDPPTWFEIALPSHLGEVYSAVSYSFGTASAGEYKFSTDYEQPMNHTNIIFIIVDQYLIASGEEGDRPDNGTQPDPVPAPNIFASIPFEAQLGVGLGVALMLFFGVVLVVYVKLKHGI